MKLFRRRRPYDWAEAIPELRPQPDEVHIRRVHPNPEDEEQPNIVLLPLDGPYDWEADWKVTWPLDAEMSEVGDE